MVSVSARKKWGDPKQGKLEAIIFVMFVLLGLLLTGLFLKNELIIIISLTTAIIIIAEITSNKKKK